MKRVGLFVILIGLGLLNCPIQEKVEAYAPILSNVQIIAIGQRLSVCHNGCTTNAEVIYDEQTGGACSTGGTAYQIWTMDKDGGHKVNQSATKASLMAFPLNVGNPKFDVSGAWVVLQAQNSASTLNCDSNGANPGAGLGGNAWICDFPAFAVCTQITHLASDLQGVLHPYLKYGYMFWMNIQGIGHTEAGIYGTFRYAPFATPGGVPTIGSLTDYTDGSSFNWYEPAGMNIADICHVAFTSGATNATTQVFKFNLCNGTVDGAFTPTNRYSEFGICDSTGSWGLSMSTQFTPNQVPASSGSRMTDLTMEACESSAGFQGLTFYNTPGSAEYVAGGAVVALPVWGNGMQYIYWTVQNPPTASRIFRATFNPPRDQLNGQSVMRNQSVIK